VTNTKFFNSVVGGKLRLNNCGWNDVWFVPMELTNYGERMRGKMWYHNGKKEGPITTYSIKIPRWDWVILETPICFIARRSSHGK